MNHLTEELKEVAGEALWSSMIIFHQDFQKEAFPREKCFWTGLLDSWVFMRHRFFSGGSLTVKDLDAALADCSVPESAIKKPGAHTLLELDNVAFVYRNRCGRDGGTELLVSPHWKGMPFSRCAHSFIKIKGTAQDLAQYLIDWDRATPELQSTCYQTYDKAVRVKEEAADKEPVAREYLANLFKGEVPSCVVYHEIDYSWKEVFSIHLAIHDEGTPFWRIRDFEIPFDLRHLLKREHIQAFIDNHDLQFGTIEAVKDEDTGEIRAVPQYLPFTSENERLGLSDE